MQTTNRTRIERLQAAIEGECDGLAVDDQHAAAILAYIDAPSERSGVDTARPDERTDAQRCIEARNRLWAALDGPGAVTGSLEEAVGEACARISAQPSPPARPGEPIRLKHLHELLDGLLGMGLEPEDNAVVLDAQTALAALFIRAPSQPSPQGAGQEALDARPEAAPPQEGMGEKPT